MSIRKFIGIALIALLCAGLFSGCILFETNTKKDYAQVVARIQNVNVGTTENPIPYSKEITKRELVVAYLNNGQSLTQQGTGMQDALEQLLDSLIQRELIIAQFLRMENAGDMVVTVADENTAWKAVYEYVDSQIQTQLQSIYAGRNETLPTVETGSYTPTYPASTLLSFLQRQTDYRDEKSVYENTTERWTPEPAAVPKADDARKLEAAKRALLSLAAQCDGMLLTRDEEAKLKADKAFINNFSNKDKLYAKVMGVKTAGGWDGFFFIQKLLYNGQLDQVKYNKMLEFYNDQVGTILDMGYSVLAKDENGEYVKDKDGQYAVEIVNKGEKFLTDIQQYYETALAAQKAKFGSGASVDYTAYFDALKNSDSKTPVVLYQPTDDFFYVKHILLPFSDAQKADIEKAV
ncbi:MAG: hypothetical protein LBL66_10445, partial [Clostridiales bacterium]|nr:hypothetical protein [Clostridiales bacterium]